VEMQVGLNAVKPNKWTRDLLGFVSLNPTYDVCPPLKGDMGEVTNKGDRPVAPTDVIKKHQRERFPDIESQL